MIAWWAASFDPSCLHHQVLLNRVISSRVQIGRLVPGFRLSVLTSWSPRTSVVSGGGFGGPVSASKIPFLADKGSTKQTCGFVAPEPGLGDVDRAPGCPLRKPPRRDFRVQVGRALGLN
jgi:hypothetical protein